ncbi:MAG: hypothetical protein EBY36_10705 [Gammaproteobacteria bacterium]|nr:hypothetical protein [Gammaproteobacteria bacterium]
MPGLAQQEIGLGIDGLAYGVRQLLLVEDVLRRGLCAVFYIRIVTEVADAFGGERAEVMRDVAVDGRGQVLFQRMDGVVPLTAPGQSIRERLMGEILRMHLRAVTGPGAQAAKRKGRDAGQKTLGLFRRKLVQGLEGVGHGCAFLVFVFLTFSHGENLSTRQANPWDFYPPCLPAKNRFISIAGFF